MEWYQERGNEATGALLNALDALAKARKALLNLKDSPYNDKKRRDSYYAIVDIENRVYSIEVIVRRMMKDYHYGPYAP